MSFVLFGLYLPSHSYFRYNFNADIDTLIICMPSKLHDYLAFFLADLLSRTKRNQERACVGQSLDWSIGTGLDSCLAGRRGGSRNFQRPVFVADATVDNKYGRPLLIAEVAAGQDRDAAIAKVRTWFARSPSLLGAIVIDVTETPKYASPDEEEISENEVDMDLWDEVVDAAPRFGPIIFQDHCWAGNVRCSFDVFIKHGEAAPRAEVRQVVSSSLSSKFSHKINYPLDRISFQNQEMEMRRFLEH